MAENHLAPTCLRSTLGSPLSTSTVLLYMRSSLQISAYAVGTSLVTLSLSYIYHYIQTLEGNPMSVAAYTRQMSITGLYLVFMWTTIAFMIKHHYINIFRRIRTKSKKSLRIWGRVAIGIMVLRAIYNALLLAQVPLFPLTKRLAQFDYEFIDVFFYAYFFFISVGIFRRMVHQSSTQPPYNPVQSPIVFLMQLGTCVLCAAPLAPRLKPFLLGIFVTIVAVLLLYGLVWIGLHSVRGKLKSLSNSYDLATFVLFGYVLIRVLGLISNFVHASVLNLFAGEQHWAYDLITPVLFGGAMAATTAAFDTVCPIIFPTALSKWMIFVIRFAQNLFSTGVAFTSLAYPTSLFSYSILSSLSVIITDAGLLDDVATMALNLVRDPRVRKRTVSTIQLIKRTVRSQSDLRPQSATGSTSSSGVSSVMSLDPQQDAVGVGSEKSLQDRSTDPESVAMPSSSLQSTVSLVPGRVPTVQTAVYPATTSHHLHVTPLLAAAQIERALFSLTARVASLACFLIPTVFYPTHPAMFPLSSSGMPPLLVYAAMLASTFAPWPLIIMPVLHWKAAFAKQLVNGRRPGKPAHQTEAELARMRREAMAEASQGFFRRVVVRRLSLGRLLEALPKGNANNFNLFRKRGTRRQGGEAGAAGVDGGMQQPEEEEERVCWLVLPLVSFMVLCKIGSEVA